MSYIPLVAFWILVYVGRRELSRKTVRIFVSVWVGALLTVAVFKLHPGFFIAIQAILDALLIVAIFGGDIEIR